MKNMYTFKEWAESSGNQYLLDLWDYELNEKMPDQLSFKSNKKVYWKCPRGLHESREITINNLTSSIIKTGAYCICKKCNSIGQYIVDNYGENYLQMIWSEKNEISSFDIMRGSDSCKIWFKCLNDDTHPDYDLSPANFKNSHNCPYCAGKRVCSTNSIAAVYPDVIDIWSDRNSKKPTELTFGSGNYVWLKCRNNKHDDFRRMVCNFKDSGIECHLCNKESLIQYEDLTGQKFGRLTVKKIDEASIGSGNIRWICDCDCGTKNKGILACHLKSEKIQSCGCYWKECISGENSYNWAGGVTSENVKARGTVAYKRWRENVLNYDNGCVICGATENLEAHHIMPFYKYKYLRLYEPNGITLCKNHHSLFIPGSFHNKYGTLNNTIGQLQKYINEEREKHGNNDPFNIYEYMNSKKKKSIGIELTMQEVEEYDNYQEET